MTCATKYYLSLLAIIILFLVAPSIVWAGGYYPVIIKNYHNYDVTNITETGVSDQDLAIVGSMAGAAAAHHFTYSVKTRQGSFSGACFDSSSDDCALSLAVAQRRGDALYSIAITGASDERLYSMSVGWTW